MPHILEGMHIRQGVPKANKLRTTRNVPNLPKKKEKLRWRAKCMQ